MVFACQATASRTSRTDRAAMTAVAFGDVTGAAS
jgi:hypothetical protein